VVHTQAGIRPDGRAPTDGEARLAAAVFAVRDGRVGTVALPWSDLLAARQLAAVTALLPGGPGWAGAVWDGVRAGTLALGVVTVLLTWAVLHRLGCAALPTGLAVALVGVTPPALAAHGAVTAAAVAVPWLLAAALLCWRGRVLGVVAAAAAVVAALTAPLVGAVLLAPAAYWAADRTLSRGLPARRGVPLAAALGGAAVGLAVAASGAGPLAGRAAPVIPTPVAVAGVVCGIVVVGAAWRVRWARALLAPAVLVLAVLLVPGPGRAAAALIGLVLLATVVAVVVDDAAARLPARVRPVAWTAAAAAVAAVTVLSVPPGRPAAAPSVPPSLIAWAQEQDESGAVLHADPLDRAELVAAGFPAERLRDLGDPMSGVDVVLLADRAGGVAPTRCADGTKLGTVPRWNGGSAEICGASAAVVDSEPAERASRVRVGTALAGNPGLRLDPAAADLLRRGDVDPRVMIVLTALTGAHTLAVADFPAGALEPADVLRRQVLVSAVDGQPAGGDAPSSLRPWLDGQNPPYAPSVVRDDRAGLVFGYRDPAPAGLLPG
jgi:hypothetical protein